MNRITKEELLEKVTQIASKLRSNAATTQDVIITGVKVREEDDWHIYNVSLTLGAYSSII